MIWTKPPAAPRRRLSAWTFCQHIVRLIEAEPRRLRMDAWTTPTWLVDRPPDCGTVCCIGGWVDQYSRHTERSRREFLCGDDLAMRDMRDDLEACFYVFPDHDHLGTRRYTREALGPFKAWMQKYQKQLKAKILDLR